MSSNSSSSNNSSSSSSSAPSPKRRHVEDIEEDRRSLVVFLLGAVGYELEADRVARVSKRILESEQIVEGISRFQFPAAGPYKKGCIRLMYAAKVGNLKLIDGVEHGMSDWTALHFASKDGHTECVRSLLDKGAMIDAQKEKGFTALHLASWDGHLDAVRLLCERGAALELQTDIGETALFSASFYNKIEVVRYLCQRGANTLLSSAGGTPYEWAWGHFGVHSPIALLLKAYPH